MKKIWQVWTDSERILFEGTESACKQFEKKNKRLFDNIRIGYECGRFYPQKGDIWYGRIAEDVVIEIKSVNKKKNLVSAKIIKSSRPNDIGQILAYILSSFNQYYRPSGWID